MHLRKLTASLHGGRECNGVVEGETERLVGLLSARIVEELGHDLVPEGEKSAAGRVGCGVLAIGASDALGERGCIPVSDIRCTTKACTYR